MGVIEKPPEQQQRQSPDFPEEMAPLYGHYKRLRFGVCYSADVVTLVPRAALSYTEIESYLRLVNWQPTSSEIETIMDIDAIFEMREVK